jgi:translation initiation factor IF-3
VIDAQGHQVGVITRFEALQMAQSAELDLVEVSPTADPPVCRIMDFGKFLLEQNPLMEGRQMVMMFGPKKK